MLDRLGRSVKNLVDLVGELHKQGIQFKSLTDAMDTGTPSGRFFFHIMASLAEMERELTVERTLQGWRLLANSAARVAENAR
jgi:DNA invertase Pin-like site-specific DNA recombinase